MTTLTESKSLTNGEAWKIGALLLFLSSMWYDLKTDQIKIQKDVDFIQYQINELKAYDNMKPTKLTALFVKPNDIRIKRKSQIITN
jgi:hypothetical protein